MPKKKKNRKRKSTKNIEELKENNEIIELKEEENEIKNDNDDKNDLLKITNIDYEKFIKINEALFEYISKSNPSIIINSDKFNSEINITNNSLIKIIKQASLDNQFKKYLTMIITSEKINYESYSSKNLSFNPKIEQHLKYMRKYNITFPSNNTTIIQIDAKIFKKIFALMNMNYYEDIFNYIELIVTRISYNYQKTQTAYILKGGNNLKKLIEENKIFYFLLNAYSVYIPLSDYSTQKIFNLINDGKDNKYSLINFKIKNEELIEEENNNKSFLDKLINASDVKNILIKYKTQLRNNELKILDNIKLGRIKEINVSDINNQLSITSQIMSNILTQISNKKEEIIKQSENITNQIVLININGKNRFILQQYLQLIENKNSDMSHISDIYDYFTNEKISLSKQNLENIKEDDCYISIIYDHKNYLIKKNSLLNIYDTWKILNQKELIDVIDINSFNNIKINVELLNIKIKEQDIIKDKDIIVDNNISSNNKSDIFDYVNNLPKKKVYKIKYKVKINRIPKIKGE